MTKKLIALFVMIFMILMIAVPSVFAAGDLFNYPRFKAIDGNGNPIRGGKLFTFQVGTTTDKATFSDSAATVANTNPVILDSNGEALIYLTGSYKMNLKTRSNGQVPGWPIDNIQGISQQFVRFCYPNSSAADHGVTGNSDTIKFCVDTTIGGTAKGTIYLQHDSGGTNTDYVFSTSETITANITVEFENGARLDPDSGKVVTVGSPDHIIALPSQQVITGDGTLAWTDNAGKAYPERWGIDGTADEVQINLALASGASIVELGHGTSIYVGAARVSVPSDVVLRGVGMPTLRFPANADSGRGIVIESEDDVTIENFKIDCNDTNHWGIAMEKGVNRVTIQGMEIDGCIQYGIVMGDSTDAGGGNDIKILRNRITGVNLPAGGTSVSQGINLFPNFGADTHAERVEITHNTVILSAGAQAGDGIKVNVYKYANLHHNYVEGDYDSTGIVCAQCQDSTINNNIVTGAPNIGISGGGGFSTDGSQTGKDLMFANNIVDGAKFAIHSSGPTTGKLNIIGNIVPSIAAAGTAIELKLVSTDNIAWGMVNISSNIVNGTILVEGATEGFEGLLIDGNSVFAGQIKIESGADYGIITNNIIRESPAEGITAQSDDMLIEGNQVIDGNTSEAASSGAFRITGDRARVYNNYAENISTGVSAYDHGFFFVNADSPRYRDNHATNMESTLYNYSTVTNVIPALANDATPSIIAGGDQWLTGGTTTITDVDDGHIRQIIIIIAEHSVTITDGTNIFLNGSANFDMTSTDTLTLIQKADRKWYEVGRGDNGA